MLPEAIAKMIGRTGDTIIMEVERVGIKRVADAVEDKNPLYWDDEYARNSRYGAIPAPPGYFGWPSHWSPAGTLFNDLLNELIDIMTQAGFPRILDGGMEYEFYVPVRAGDTLAATPKFIDITERETKSGNMYLSMMEITYLNQNGQLAARSRNTVIYR